jgi:radical SAM family uncharacterized protein
MRSDMRKVELSEELLLSVRKPARYIGSEHNAVIKNWDKTDIKFCLCFPDLYEIGMSNLGIKIIYHILNQREDVLCERCFAPWVDMEKAMKKGNIPLFSLESRMPVSSFDIIGFSLAYELCYTNILTMLDLAGLPFKSIDRIGAECPLIIAGGPCAFNPEPLAYFIDVFLIGDAEESVLELADTYKRYKGNKQGLLESISGIEGAYVPAVHNGKKIKKRTVACLSMDNFPTRQLVPFVQTVHDRMAVEIMRGCPNSCHFCQAGRIYAPVRIRDKNQVIDISKALYRNTGMDELSLLSLSSSSYPAIEELIQELTEFFMPLGVGLSLPSIRIEDASKNLPFLISRIKKSGLTFAPEVGSERMLEVINKTIDRGKLFITLKDAFKRGWQRVKLYFMIGLPGETDEDIESIISFSSYVAMLKKECSAHPAEVTVSVSSFIPKPHTFFEREGMSEPGELRRKQEMLFRKAKPLRYLKLKFNDVNTSIMESVFSRGDRKLSEPLLRAWANNARFDAWQEAFNFEIWQKAFSDCSVDMHDYLMAKDRTNELPWSHIYCR